MDDVEESIEGAPMGRNDDGPRGLFERDLKRFKEYIEGHDRSAGSAARSLPPKAR
jgi:hypothetical protein